MVRKSEYPKKNDLSKNDVPSGVAQPSNSTQKSGEFHHKENSTRNSRPPRENQQRDNNQQKEYQRREPKRENTTRVNQTRDSVQKENTIKENNQRDNSSRENHQKNYHREPQNNKETREPYRQHYQRNVIKPKTEETVEDIANDIVRIEKEIDLEIKEIKSLRLGL